MPALLWCLSDAKVLLYFVKERHCRGFLTRQDQNSLIREHDVFVYIDAFSTGLSHSKKLFKDQLDLQVVIRLVIVVNQALKILLVGLCTIKVLRLQSIADLVDFEAPILEPFA